MHVKDVIEGDWTLQASHSNLKIKFPHFSRYFQDLVYDFRQPSKNTDHNIVRLHMHLDKYALCT